MVFYLYINIQLLGGKVRGGWPLLSKNKKVMVGLFKFQIRRDWPHKNNDTRNASQSINLSEMISKIYPLVNHREFGLLRIKLWVLKKQGWNPLVANRLLFEIENFLKIFIYCEIGGPFGTICLKLPHLKMMSQFGTDGRTEWRSAEIARVAIRN